jgi:lipopolysaccharide heptosyltransferase II
MLYIILSTLFYPLIFLAAMLRRRRAIRRILIIQRAKIGDMVCSTAVFRLLKKRYPRARIAVMADPASCGILEANPLVDEIIPFKTIALKGLGRKLGIAGVLMREGFDLSVCLSPDITNTIIPLWALIPRRLSVGPDRAGITFKLAALFNNRVVWHETNRSVPETYALLLQKALGIPRDKDSARLELPVTGEALEKVTKILTKAKIEKGALIVGMAPAARNKLKEVSPKLYAEVADELVERFGVNTLLIGGPCDKADVRAVMEHMKHKAVDTSGRFSISELPALLVSMDLFISVDSGPVYMAIAMGVPTINMAGPCAMEERPLGTQNTVIQKDLPCSPCSYTFHTATSCRKGDRECVTALTAGPVIEAAARVLKAKIENRKKENPEARGAAPTAGSL